MPLHYLSHPFIFAYLITIKDATNAIKFMVVSNTFNTNSLHYAPNTCSQFIKPMVHLTIDPTPFSLLTIPLHHRAPSPDTWGSSANPEFSFSEKVKIQITDKSIISGPPFTFKGPSKMKVKDKTISLDFNYSSNTQL